MHDTWNGTNYTSRANDLIDKENIWTSFFKYLQIYIHHAFAKFLPSLLSATYEYGFSVHMDHSFKLKKNGLCIYIYTHTLKRLSSNYFENSPFWPFYSSKIFLKNEKNKNKNL